MPLICMPMLCAAQVELSAEWHRGFLLPHRQNMRHLPAGSAQCAEVRIMKKMNENKSWHKIYNSPSVGLTLRGFDLANRDLLGYGIAAGALFSSSIVSSKRFKWVIEMGSGLGYLSEKFDYQENYKNIAIGSDINAFIVLGQRFAYQVAHSLKLVSSMSFNHFSNAAFSLPNLGLNYPMISFGMQHNLSSQKFDNIEPTSLHIEALKVASYTDISLSFGVKEARMPHDQKFMAYSLSIQRAFGLSAKSSLAAGVDGFYNTALTSTEPAQPLFQELADTQAGLRLAYQMHIDRLILGLHMGAYIYDKHKADGLLYHRAGLRYYITNHLGINLSLKTHFFKADYFELGMAYKF